MSGSPYLIPQTVYVGDRATLVVPLGDGVQWSAGITEYSGGLPRQEDIVIHSVKIERRSAEVYVLIEFTSYKPGPVIFPPLSLGPEVELNELTVEIASILSSGGTSMVLSSPASPVAVPGTSVLIYGASAFLFFLIVCLLAVRLWGRNVFRAWLLKRKKLALVYSLANLERHIRRELGREGYYNNFLHQISLEFRSFLTLFTGSNCRSMTAGELRLLPPLLETARTEPALTGEYIGDLLGVWDNLRFSGGAVSKGAMTDILDKVKTFTITLEKLLKTRQKPACESGIKEEPR
jgi:hypothetical protein